jgi:hypothetical protein
VPSCPFAARDSGTRPSLSLEPASTLTNLDGHTQEDFVSIGGSAREQSSAAFLSHARPRSTLKHPHNKVVAMPWKAA